MTSAQTLYQTDLNLWLQETASLLRNGDVEQLDCQSLAEEIEDMAGSRKDALEINLIRVLQHLLKWKYQPQKRTNSWKASITEHSLRLNKAFKKSPSLKPYFEQVFAELSRCKVDYISRNRDGYSCFSRDLPLCSS